MTYSQPCNLHGLGLLPYEVGVTLLPPHSVVGKLIQDHLGNVFGTSLRHKLPPAWSPALIHSRQHWIFP